MSTLRSPARRAVAVLAVSVLTALAACSSDAPARAARVAAPSAPATTVPRSSVGATPSSPPNTRGPVASAPAHHVPTLPPANVGFDYQLGGAYAPAADVVVLGRDRTDAPLPGRYNICYVNGFQTQPGERVWWETNHPELVLSARGVPVIDPDWPDEDILDISTPSNRAAIASIVGGWIAGCATAGFDAVEIDNLDTFTRFPTRLTENDAVAQVALYAATAHDNGLAIAQKNTAEIVARKAETGLDFAVVEQCGEFDECESFTTGYGTRVFDIEYDATAFAAVCVAHPELSIVLRDLQLVTPSSGAYVRSAC